MSATRLAAKIAFPVAAILLMLTACQGVYVAGDAGPHSTTSASYSRAAPRDR